MWLALTLIPCLATALHASPELDPTPPQSENRRNLRFSLHKPQYSAAVKNFSVPGLCYPLDMESVYDDHWEQIEGDVLRGRRRAADMKVIFAGLVRDAALSVFRSYKMLQKIGAQFKDYHFLVLENDSKDSTSKFLKHLASKDSRYEVISQVLSMGNEKKLEAARMERMAILRNKLHDWVREFIRKSPRWDLVVLVDFDIPAATGAAEDALSAHGVFGALGRRETADNGWDMLCAQGLTHDCGTPLCDSSMHDCFAFRGLDNDSFNSQCDRPGGRSAVREYGLVPVHSCFGGLAMYRTEKFLGCRYDPGVYDCEHVPLHKCMRDKGSDGRMFMDPLLTIRYDSWVYPTCRSSADRLSQLRDKALAAEMRN